MAGLHSHVHDMLNDDQTLVMFVQNPYPVGIYAYNLCERLRTTCVCIADAKRAGALVSDMKALLDNGSMVFVSGKPTDVNMIVSGAE
eukprot:8660574-Karenia_brevis.AAC.1